MLTSLDKTIVAAIMGGAQIANAFGFHWGVDENTVTTVVAAMTPFLVWLFPNKT